MGRKARSIQAMILAVVTIISLLPFGTVMAYQENNGERARANEFVVGKKYCLRHETNAISPHITSDGGLTKRQQGTKQPLWTYTQNGTLHNEETNTYLACAGGVLLVAKQQSYALNAVIEDGYVAFYANGTEKSVVYDTDKGAFYLGSNASRKIVAYTESTKDEPEIVLVTGITSPQTDITLTLNVNNECTLQYEIAPENATNKNVSWTSTNDEIVSVADGVVTAHTKGEAEIIATTEDGGFTCTYSISVVLQSFTVTFFDYNGNVIDTQSVEHSSAATAPELPNRDGYAFVAWSCDFSCVTEDLNVYPTYSASTFDIAYHTNGGFFLNTPISLYTIESDTIILPLPSRSGYAFAGWYENAELTGDAISEIPTGSFGNKAFYAAWTIATYTITYVTNGGTFAQTPQTSYTILSDSVLLAIPQRDGYTFSGWYESAIMTGSPITEIGTGSFGDKTFYALWTVQVYAISYVTNGGTLSVSPITSYTIESESIVLPTPTKTAYTFMGWYEDEAFTGSPVSEITSGSFGDKTFYALWSATFYTITYEVNGGTLPQNIPTDFTIESEKITLPSPTRNGYSFIGWYDNAKLLGDIVTEIESGSYGNRTYFAAWSLETYTITYETNGGTLSGLAPETYTVESPVIVLPQVQKRGCSFLGWYEDVTFSTSPITEIAAGSTGNIKLYARFEYITYTITYETNGGVLPQNYPTGYSVTSEDILLPIPTKNGYSFMGWYENADLSGEAVSCIIKGSIDNKQYYAAWEVVTYTITYETNGGTVAINAPTTYTIESARITLVSATRRGYTFAGWYDNASLSGGKVTAILPGSTGNRVFYAAWIVNTYTITYVTNGGTAQNMPTRYTIESSDIILYAATRTGYNFVGWYENAQFGGEKVTVIMHGSTGNKTLYAKWEPIVYTIAYVTNGGTLASGTPTTYTIESASISLSSPSKRGYLFSGWFDDATFSGNAVTSIQSGSYGNRVFYARWNVITYELSYVANGGTLPQSYVRTFTVESYAIALPIPTRTAYTFAGWYDNQELSGDRVYELNAGSIGNRTYYAAWQAITYTITYETNGGVMPNTAQTTYTIESATITLQSPTKSGYNFVGWFELPSFTGDVHTQINTGSYGNITLYAKWNAVVYTIEYVTNGGEFTLSIVTEYSIESSEIVLPMPERKGYSFVGWYANADFSGERIVSIAAGSIGNVRVFADWHVITYIITYHVYDGTMPESFDSEYTIESETITLPRPTQTGFVFVGWYPNESFSGVAIREIAAGSFGNIELYANWRRLVYTVNFYDWDRETLLATVRTDYGMAATAPSVPEHYGFTFARWSEDINFVSHNMDVYAIYETAKYNVVFVDIDYTVLSVQEVLHGESAVAPMPPLHEGSVFVFWSVDYSCVTSNMTVVAVYRATAVIPVETETERFVNQDEFEDGEEYVIVTRSEYGDMYALSNLERLEGSGLWGIRVNISQYSIVAEDGTLDDALFVARGANYLGYSIESSMSGNGLFYKNGYFIMDESTQSGDTFAYQYQNGAWRLYDKTKNVYLAFNNDGYFETSDLSQSAEIVIYKHIKMRADYLPQDGIAVDDVCTLIAVRPDGKAYALSCNDEGNGLVGYEVRIIGGKAYFNDNIDERNVAFRIASQNGKGYYIRNVKTGKYLGITEDGTLTASDEPRQCEYWRFGPHDESGSIALQDTASGKYIYCSDEGHFSAQSTITHSEIRAFERINDCGRVCDVNGDGRINTGDATMLLRHLVGIGNLHEEEMFDILDGNNDGKVNTGDATIILRYVVGAVDWFK